MSDETSGGILRHKDTRHIQVRLDYMLLYRNETKAMIIRIMETWTNQKRAEWYKQSLDNKEQGKEPPEDELWVTMQQAREIEQLTEQLDASNVVKLETQLKEANESIEVWRDRAQHWKAEYEDCYKMQEELKALRQQQIMLTTTTPGTVKPKGKAKPTGKGLED